MKNINLYRYETGNGVIITPNAKNETDIPSRMRLVADENKALTNGETITLVVDVLLEDIKNWYEIDYIEEPISEMI